MRNSRYYNPTRWPKQMEGHLTPGEQYSLRSELVQLKRIARIAMPDALYDASVSARTFAAQEQVILNPIAIGDVVDANIPKSTENLKYAQARGYDGFLAKRSKDSHKVNMDKNTKGW